MYVYVPGIHISFIKLIMTDSVNLGIISSPSSLATHTLYEYVCGYSLILISSRLIVHVNRTVTSQNCAVAITLTKQ